MQKLRLIYEMLLSRFGRQGWWPVTKEGKLCPEYSNGPESERQRLEVAFGAILTQNTNWRNVEKAIAELNKNGLIDANKIHCIGIKKLALLIKSSGYHTQKAKRLKNFCNFLLRNYDGNLKKMLESDIKKMREGLLSINGIGPETADSIILYAAKKPIFVVDAYTKRIFNRIGCKENAYEELQKLFMESLPNSEKLFNEYHALLVRLGKNVCRKNPLCNECPISGHCDYFKTNSKYSKEHK